MSVTKILQRKTKTNLVENLCIFLHFSQLLTKVTYISKNDLPKIPTTSNLQQETTLNIDN